MRKKLIWCLFFFCMLSCCGCKRFEKQMIKESSNGIEKNMAIKEDDQGKEDNLENEDDLEKEQAMGNVWRDDDLLVVLTAGDDRLDKTAAFICEKMRAVHYNLPNEEKEKMNRSIEDGKVILIGTNQNPVEFEFSVRNSLEEEMLKEKRVALFLIDREEDVKIYQDQFASWYPKAALLPAFTMSSDSETFEEEMGRMNGWLTTAMTWGQMPE